MSARQIIVIFCLFFVLFSVLSVASANEDINNITLAVANDQNIIDIASNNEGILQEPSGTFSDLDTDIQSNPENQNLTLGKDFTYSGTGNVIEISKDIVIDGDGHTIDADGKVSIFDIKNNSHVVLKNIIFTNGYGVNGSAVDVHPGSYVEIINCSFINNNASNYGGAIYIQADSSNKISKITSSIFIDNHALNGGAVYVHSDKATIEGSTFTGNKADNDGAGIFVAGDNCNLANSNFTGSIAGDDGSAIYWEGNNGLIANVSCVGNRGISGIDPRDKSRSSSKGGTICLTGSDVTIKDSNFSNSYAGFDGGALFITGNNDFVVNCVFNNCTSHDENGGALYIIGNNTEIIACDFIDCNANLSGGAIYVEGHDVSIDHSTFTGNGANLDGAALYVAGDNGILSNSTFAKNIAGDDGGAVYWEGDNGYIYNISCTNNKGISDNKGRDPEPSNSKGGTICLTGSNVTIDKSNFTQSSAVVDGGALFITGNDVKVLNSEFSDCTSADSSGGAMYIIGNNTAVSNCTFDDCSVKNLDPTKHRGGAIFVEGNSAHISDSSFTNTHGLIGGAIYIAGDDTAVDNSVFSHNDAVGIPGGSGGAIHVDGAGTVVSNSEFSYGTAVNYGGALSIWGSNTKIVNNTFEQSKTTKFNGGAVFVNGENTTILNSNFTKCNALGDQYARGGAIDVQGANTNISDCNFDDCDSHFGGVIHVSGTDAFIGNSNFKGSDAYEGGAIFVEGVNTVISKSNFTNSVATNYGGTIYVSGANANISECNFNKTTVKNYNGGAIFISGENTIIEKSKFTSADASNSRNHALGGAIYIAGSNSVVKESDFEDCKANEGGGAIYAYGNDAKIEDSTFNSSTAKYGGAIYLTSWGAFVTRSNISECIATQNGGGVYVANGSIQITESNFDECIAKGTAASNGGGAIYINGPDTHISASNFTHNTVPSSARGGSIFINGERTIIDSSEFVGGSANNGGEIYIEGENAIIDTSSFINSSSRISGGSIYVKGDEATVRSSSFDNISSVRNGGAIFVDGEQTDILSSSFYNCTVGKGSNGGAIYIYNNGTTVAYSNFSKSKANEGGAIYISGVNTTITYCNLEQNVANSAGAIKVFGDDAIISNCNFTYNNATATTGGALDIGGANASVYYSWFDHNVAKLEGGAINWLGGHGDDSIIGSTFTNNVGYGTSRGGGAIYWTQGLPIASGGLIKDCIFINNTAAGKHGGAIDWYQALDSVIENCLFINNTALCDGGALYTGDQGGNSVNLTIIYCQFYNNSAKKYGGAIANQMANSYIFNNTFDGNTAWVGGGTILMKEGPADNCIVDHCYIFNSHVGNVTDRYGEGGGAILIGSDSNITISNSAIFNSTIGRGPGGAIAIFGPDCSLINVSIEDASSQNDDGGAIYWKGTNGKMDNVTIVNASSNSRDSSRSSNGGAIHISGWYCNANDIKIFQSSANNDENCAKTNYGGAIYVSGSYDVLTNIVIDNASSKNVKMNAGGGAIFYDGYGGTLINATISNTLATGNGGAIYWKGSTPTAISNISITYSQTEVINSTNTADGGAIYTTTVTELNNVYINGARAYKNTGDVHGGAIYMKDAMTLNNVTVIGSRASTDAGTSMGGAVYFMRDRGSSNVYVYNSTFKENNADLGGGLYFQKITARIYDTSFTGNVANQNGGALYSQNEDEFIYNSTLDHNSAKKGGAIFSQDGHIQISDSTFEFNTAEEKGGAIYYNYNNKAGSSVLLRVNLLNNTAFQGSAMYGTKFNKLSLTDVTLLDNQANSKEFIEKHVGVDGKGNNYTSAVFLGFDNLLNAIWQESTYAISCTNVTYWGVGGKKKTSSPPTQSDREVNINVTVEMYDDKGVQLKTVDLVTDENGKVTYNFDAEDGKTYYFAYVHKSDRYYTYLRDTLSNSSLVKIYVYTPIFYAQNQTVLIELTDGAWGNLNGTVTVTFNDTAHTTFTVDVLNGTGFKYNITDLAIGKYNATASYPGDINHTGDTDWVLFEVLPYNDLEITKTVDVTADYVNVTDVIKYTITVTNHGPSKAYGVNVTERLSPYLKLINSKATQGNYNLTGGYWYIGELDVNDFETLTIQAEVIHMGPITNTVWVTGLGKDINETNNVASARNFTAFDIVDLSIYKDVNVTTDVVNVLDTIQFNITVFNDGPSNATGVIVEELLDDHLEMISNNPSVGTYNGGTWNIGKLLKGANATLTIVAKIIYSGNISNVVSVSGFENETDYTNNRAAIKNLTAIANVDLEVNKYVDVKTDTVNVTDNITFTITVTNNGPCNATGVYVGETLSPHLNVLSNTTTRGKWDGSTWIIGNLNGGETHYLTIVAEVISAGTISNAVAIYGNDNDTNRSNNNDSIKNITSIDIVDLEINKTVDVKTSVVNVTDMIVFTIKVKNNGPCDATNVNVTEKLSDCLRFVNCTTWASTYDEVAGIWYIGNLAKGDWRELDILAEVIKAGTISNVVVVNSTEKDTNESNNNASVPNITARDVVDLQITKKVNVTSYTVNVTDYIKYTIEVFNAGPSNATNVNVTEKLSDNLKLIKNETDHGYYNLTGGYWYIGELKNQSKAVLTIEAQVIKNGTLSNKVVVNCTEIDSNPYNNEAEVDRFAVYIVDLQIKKEAIAPSTVGVNTEIVFNITVHNAGPCNATGVYVCEPLSDNLEPIEINASQGSYVDKYTWNIGNMTSGSNVTLTIKAKVIYVGVIKNAVNVTCNEVDTNLTNNKDNITPIDVTDKVDLGINKTVNASVVNVSDWIEFHIVAYNNCSLNAGGVYVLEALDFTHLGRDYTYVATPGTTYDGYTWRIGQLNASSKATLNITAHVIKQGNFSNYVQIFVYNDNNTSNDNYTVNITARPVVDLGITKDVNVGNLVYYNDTVKFTITVRNNGPCDATNVNVTEALDPHLKLVNYTQGCNYDVNNGIWYVGDLAKDDWRQLEIVARVISIGNFTNVVSVKSTENDTNKSNNNASLPNITAVPIVDLRITKEVNVTGNIVNVTDYIKFTIKVFNDGPCNATNINVTEKLSPHLKLTKNVTVNGYYNVTEGVWHIGDLKNQSEAVLTIEAQVISEGIISNVVIVNATEKDTNSSNDKSEIENLTAVIVFDLQIKKDANVSGNIDVTDKIKFNITVYNAGPCNATDVYVIEPLADNLRIITNTTTQGDYDGYKWYIGNLTVGANATLTIETSIAYGGIILNTVNVTGNGIDYNLSNNKDSVVLNASSHVDLIVFKSDNLLTNRVVNVTDWVEFTIFAYNNGPCNATGVYVREALDFTHLGRDYTYVATPGTTYDGYTWRIGNLDSKGNAYLKISARVIAPGNFSNYVEITSPDNDTDPSNNNASIKNITALPIVDLSITKESDVINNIAYYNDTIKFTITVRNNGPCDATNVNVTEVLDSHLKLIKNETANGYYNVTDGVWYIGYLAKDNWAQLVIQARVISVGNITNVVNVTSTENDTNKSNNNASIPNITAVPIVDLRIIKTVDVNTTEVYVTDVLKFTITVFNDGPCNATNVYVYEPLNDCLKIINYTLSNNTPEKQRYDGYTWVIGNMTNGTNTTLTIVARIAYSGTIENYVNVTSNDTDIDPTNNEDQITPLHATTHVDLTINKTVNVTTGVVYVGNWVEFNITAYNNGPCNASGVYVLEALDFTHLGFDYKSVVPAGTTYDGYTWYIGHMDAGTNITLSIAARVTEQGNFSNYVEIFGYDEDTNTSNNNATLPNITAMPVVDLSITKEVNVGSEVLVGQTVVFTITVRNNGPSDATNVNVTEVLSSHLNMTEYITWDSHYDVDAGVWYIGDLARYDWRQIIIVTEVVSVGNISNVVVVTSTENDTNKSNNNASIPNITAKPAVDLQIMKDVNVTSRIVEVNDYIRYIITVYNDGPCNATNVNVSEKLSPFLKFNGSETKSGYYNVTEGIWHIGDLANGSTATLTIDAQVVVNGTVISNVVIVNSSENDTNPYNDRDEVIIAALPVVDLKITKEVNVTSEIGVTDKIKFTITVTNLGPCNATGVYVIESLSDKLRLISNVTSQGHYDGYTWNIDNITNGSSVTLIIEAQVIYAGNISNVVVAYAYQNETNYTNNNASIPNITAVNNVDLRISKSVDVSGYVNVTDKITFIITVTNRGPCNATGVFVSETLSPHLKLLSNSTTKGEWDGSTWVIGNLTDGEVQNLTIVAEVISAGNISNVVSIISGDNDTNKSNNNASIENITAENIVDLNITKTVDVKSGIVVVGDTIVFTITVRNNGPCDATGVNVTEVLSPHLKFVNCTTWDSHYDVDAGVWYIGNLSKNDWRELIILAKVVSVGNITNVVSVNSTENDTNSSNNNASTPNITAIDVVDLVITKDVNVGDSVLVGQTVIFIITVRNNGPGDATNVNVTEVLSPHLKMVGYSTWDSYYDVDVGVWYIGNLSRYDWRQLVIMAEVVSVGNISNVVVVTSTENDTNKSNNNASIPNITAKPAVDLQIMKDVNVTSRIVEVNDYIRYIITVYNDGPCNATNVNVSEKLSPFLKFNGSETKYGYYNVTEGIWHIGDLANGSTATLTIDAQVVVNGTVISNVVVVNSSENEINPYNNRAEVTIAALPLVDLRITKEVNVTSEIGVTDWIEFVITVYNDGPCNATGAYVIESLSDKLHLTRNVTSQGYYDGYTWNIGNITNGSSVTLTLVAQVIHSGNISNVVVAYAYQNETNYTNNNASIPNITAVNNVDLRISKSVDVSGYVNVTDKITFIITVTNRGPCNATGVFVSETLSPHLKLLSNSTTKGEWDGSTWVIGNLTDGEVQNLTIVAEVISAGNISNVVSIISGDNDTNKSNNNASIENITAENIVDLNITKTVDVKSGVVVVGDTIVFTITVRNNGPCDATGVNVTEVLSPHLKMTDYHTWSSYYNVTEGVWYIGNLSRNDWRQLVIVTEVVSVGNISNVVVVTSTENDTNKSNNNASIPNITAVSVVDLYITKTVNVTGLVNVTDLVKYTITVVNNGPSNATGVNVTDKLDSKLEFVSFDSSRAGITYDSKSGIAAIGNLNVNETVVLYIVAKVTASGVIPNTVNVTSTENDTNESNNKGKSDDVTALPVVDLEITKLVNVTTGVVNVSDLIEFTIIVTNNGPCDATGVYVGETLNSNLRLVSKNPSVGSYDGFTWTIGDLANQSSAVLTIVARVVSTGNISNVVSVKGVENDTNASNNEAYITNITSLPVVDLIVTKTVNSTVANVTGLVEYKIVVVNAGPCDATGVNVVENLSPFVKLHKAQTGVGYYDNSTNIWYIGDLSVDKPVVLTLTVQIIANGTVENSVSVTSRENDTNKSNNNGSSDNVTSLPVVDISISKVVNVTVVNVTDLVEYTITVRNNGPSNATGVNVFDKLDSKLKFDSFASSRAGITYDSNSSIILVGNLDVNETVILTITAKVIEMGEISNAVNVTSVENDTDKSNNNGSSDNVTSLPIVDLQINKTVSVNAVKIGEEFTYYITVVNNGPSTATNVNVLENLSEYLTLIENTASKGNYDLKNSIWYIGNLTKDESATLKLVVKAVSNATIVNVVYVTGSENDTNLTNNNCTSDNVTVNRLDTPISINTYDITYGDDEIIVVTLPDGATGTVNITVGNYSFTDLPIENGKVILPVSDLAGGNYTARVEYGGNNVYLPNSTSGTFNVARVVPIITIEVEDIWAGEIEVVNVTVNAPGVVYVTVYNRTVEISLDNGVVTTDILAASKNSYSGNATWNILNLPVGAYPAFALYPGNENYTSVNISDLFHVRDKNSTVVVTADDIYVGEDAVIYIKVGPEGVSGNVTVTVDGKKYILPIDENGKATLTVSGLKAGKKLVTVEYNGTILYRPSENSTTFNVLKLKPTIDVFAPEITVGDDGVITVNVPKDATGTITIEIEGRRYSAPIENGKAVFIVPGLKAGLHVIKVYYSGDGKYLSANTTGSIKVKPLKENKTDNKTTTSTKHSHGGVSLNQYPTANPIWMIVCVLLSICTIQLRRFKK